MQWEILLAIILAIGVGITVKEALAKRTMNRTKNKGGLSDQCGHDTSKDGPPDKTNIKGDN